MGEDATVGYARDPPQCSPLGTSYSVGRLRLSTYLSPHSTSSPALYSTTLQTLILHEHPRGSLMRDFGVMILLCQSVEIIRTLVVIGHQ